MFMQEKEMQEKEMQEKEMQNTQKPKDKQKKLLIKKIMVWSRQGFNVRKLGFHPFLLCASIKPGAQKRHKTLQSYPNAELWRCLSKLSQMDYIKEIQQEICIKLQKADGYDSSLIKEFQIRVKNNFDFAFLYKESEQKSLELEENQYEEKVQNLNLQEPQEKEESESKSLAKQIELCNTQQGSVALFETSHYHKLSQFFEKITNIINQSSLELRQFYNGLELFLESQQLTKSKKIMKVENFQNLQYEVPKEQEIQLNLQQQKQQNQMQQLTQGNHQSIQDNQQYKQQQQQQQQIMPQIKSQEQLLNEIKLDSLKLQPGLALFLPNYSRMEPQEAERVREIEQQFFTELYYLKISEPDLYNPKQILFLWRTVFESKCKKTNPIELYLANINIKRE